MTHRQGTPAPLSPALAALRIAYSDLTTIAMSIDEPDSWRPTRCAGWVVRDLVLHVLGDAQRALVALGTPAAGPADRDFVTYWTDVPGGRDDDSTELRAQRIIASAWALAPLARTFAETTRAVVTLADRASPDALVATQDHVLRVEDLITTLAVEAAVHHLDLVVDMNRPGPRPEPLALVRETLDGLLGHSTPPEWSDERWALVGTGRVPPGGRERRELGPAAGRLPLLG
ncbi:maleylpyruvate isomerase N-terminal domain-containing protein [Pseudonocardia sp. TRM90224]|uniref:maleylpyruvate isomerase N-terminal domain-containing protein n=1 Tax=Pseudonocardia sp. TRM90224 TaxID=2812678 RepID=UPI001E538EEB|nr:maleylpyruvate isomerase N-terminal domain-containing protein [Pseudonocardia sp. TRM90224]